MKELDINRSIKRNKYKEWMSAKEKERVKHYLVQMFMFSSI